MPYTSIVIREGFYTEDTRSDSGARWINGNRIRFVTDFPQKIGGWNKLSNTQLRGVCRQINTWTSVENYHYSAFGTNAELAILYDNFFTDITPQQTGSYQSNIFTATDTSANVTVTITDHGLTTSDYVFFSNVTPFAGITINGIYAVSGTIDANNFTITASSAATSSPSDVGGSFIVYYIYYSLTNPFTTTMGSSIVQVTQNAHGENIGDYVTFINYTNAGGVDFNGSWTILNVIDANNYTFDSGQVASSSVSLGGGDGNYAYQIESGAVNTSLGDGYGIDTYGGLTWGTPRDERGVIYDYPRIWSQSTWGDDLIASPRDCPIYYWFHQDAPITNIATIIPNAPIQNKWVSVWPESQIVVAYGTINLSTGLYDPMCVRWSSLGDFTDWLPESFGGAAASTSGQQVLTLGNEILSVSNMRGQVFVCTDTNIYAQYAVQEGTFAFKSVAESRVCGPNSPIEANGVIYYMGEQQFYKFDGTLQIIKCDVRQAVFENINLQQLFKVYGSFNTAYNECWWFYPSANYNSNGVPTNLENNMYVVYNVLKNIWYYGELNRTAYIDIGEYTPNPIATDELGYVYEHEDGLDDDAQPMFISLESGDMNIMQGNKFTYVKNLIPDLVDINKPFQIYITVRNYPQSPPRVYGPYTISPEVLDNSGNIMTPATDVIGTRAKGGYFSIKYVQNDPAYPQLLNLGARFEIGQIEVQLVPTGVK